MNKILALALTIVFSFGIGFCQVFASASNSMEIKDFSFAKKDQQGKVSIMLKGKRVADPVLMIRDNIIQVTLPKTVVWPKIEKSVSLNKKFDTKVLAYQFDKNTVRFRVILPYSLMEDKAKVKLSARGNKIDVVFPNEIKKPGIVDLNEEYLDKLLAEGGKKEVKPAKDDFDYFDRVNSGMSGTGKKDTDSSWSLWSYAAKALAFLVLVLALFYALIFLLKKIIFKKGKLGFLNSTKVIEVLSTTYLAHKRSLMLIRVHKQVFLVANTEKGIEFLSEISSTTGLLKEGERQIAGDNFDTNLKRAEATGKEFPLKEPLSETVEEPKDKVRFSEQIKDKIKKLRPLQ